MLNNALNHPKLYLQAYNNFFLHFSHPLSLPFNMNVPRNTEICHTEYWCYHTHQKSKQVFQDKHSGTIGVPTWINCQLEV